MSGSVIILTADDYAISAGVSRGIDELARARRLSATGAIVTLPRWREDAQTLKALRGDVAIGLHINLTLGAPLTPLPSLAPEGRLPSVSTLISRALTARLDKAALTAEITRQLTSFIEATGYPPDFVDGHQHVHALPIIRGALVAALAPLKLSPKPLVRSPADNFQRISQRGLQIPKSMVLAGLAKGFGAYLERHGMVTNDSFSGVSSFERSSPYADELVRALEHAGRRHLIMCHPGHPDAELAALDPVVERRQDEYDALMSFPDLSARIWHPNRTIDGPAVDWSAS